MYDNKVKISELTAATNIGDNDVVAGVVNNNTAKISVAVLKNTITENIYNKSEVDQLISVLPKFAIAVVNDLPTADISDTTIYLVKAADDGPDMYSEHIYVSNRWEDLGKQTVDLSNYYTKEETNNSFVSTSNLTLNVTAQNRLANYSKAPTVCTEINYASIQTNANTLVLSYQVRMPDSESAWSMFANIPTASTTKAGALSATDKVKIDNIPEAMTADEFNALWNTAAGNN